MSDVVPHKKARAETCRLRSYRAPVKSLDFGEGGAAVVVSFYDGALGLGTCLGCRDTPCMTLALADLGLPELLSDFPGDPDREVCPTSALSWADVTGNISVNEEACVGCGLCVSRCPYGAISIENVGKAKVQDSDPDGLTIIGVTGDTLHPSPEKIGCIGASTCDALAATPSTMSALSDAQTTRFVRNVFIQIKVGCRTRRKGDTNVRMDGVLDFSIGRIGVLEIETENAVLDSPRALIEDVAVLKSRYDIPLDIIDPVSVILWLPNKRSEYYQVIEDIEKVLGLRCRTVTIGLLLLLMWNFQELTGITESLFMTNSGGTDLSAGFEGWMASTLSPEPYPGAVETPK